MKAEFGFIAESADAVAGLFYVVRGGTDIWNVPPGATFPLTIGPMSFVIRLNGEINEVGTDIPVKASIVDADGQTIGFEGHGGIRLPDHPIDRTRTGSALIHFRLAIQIPAPGAYFFDLHTQEQLLTRIPLWVVQGSATTGPPPGQIPPN